VPLSVLDAYGRQGWELVAVIVAENDPGRRHVAYMKRELLRRRTRPPSSST
jgi:hypothetical protein